MSTAPATASSSSSASSRLSWHPSQEANLNTPMRGLCFSLELIFLQQRPDAVIGKNRTVFADEVRPVLAVAAEADGALHIAFHGKINLLAPHTVRLQVARHEAHHDFGAASESYRTRWLQPRLPEQRGHDADMSAPAHSAVVDCD